MDRRHIRKFCLQVVLCWRLWSAWSLQHTAKYGRQTAEQQRTGETAHKIPTVLPHWCLQVFISPKDNDRLERSSCLQQSQAFSWFLQESPPQVPRHSCWPLLSRATPAVTGDHWSPIAGYPLKNWRTQNCKCMEQLAKNSTPSLECV